MIEKKANEIIAQWNIDEYMNMRRQHSGTEIKFKKLSLNPKQNARKNISDTKFEPSLVDFHLQK